MQNRREDWGEAYMGQDTVQETRPDPFYSGYTSKQKNRMKIIQRIRWAYDKIVVVVYNA